MRSACLARFRHEMYALRIRINSIIGVYPGRRYFTCPMCVRKRHKADP